MSRIAFIRVSTLGQSVAHQKEAFKDLTNNKYFEEKVLGRVLKIGQN